VKGLGQSNVDGIVSRQVVSQLPNSWQKKRLFMAIQLQRRVIIECIASRLGCDITPSHEPANYLRDLDIGQMRDVQSMPGIQQPFLDIRCGRQSEKCLN
jgi:hypothetical protein